MNYSVVPWNLGIACIGYWVLRQSAPAAANGNLRLPRWEKALLAVLLVVPLGFYTARLTAASVTSCMRATCLTD